MAPWVDQSVAGFEYALVAAGLGLFAWLFFRPAGRAALGRPPLLPVWEVSLTDFLFLGWLIIALAILGQIVIQVAVGNRFSHLTDGATLEVVTYGSMFDFAAVATALIGRVYLRRLRPSSPAALPPRPSISVPKIAAGGLLTFLAAMPTLTAAGLVWTPILKVLGLPTEPQPLIGLFANTHSLVVLAPMIALAIVLAPMAEETVFRAGIFRYLRSGPPLAVVFGAMVALPVLYLGGEGFLALFHGGRGDALQSIALAAGIAAVAYLSTCIRAVRRMLARPTPRWVAFTVSAGLFALLHANWVSFLPLFALGLIFAAAYERTGLIAVSILAHALFNLNTLLLVLTGNAR